MKIKLFLTIFLIEIFYYSYAFAFDEEFLSLKNVRNEGIKEITEYRFDKWKVLSFFDKQGFLLQEINYYKKEMRAHYRYEYAVSDTLLEIKRAILNNNEEDTCFIDMYYYDLGQCYKFRRYSSEELNVPSFFGDNFIYKNGLLVSYERNNILRKNRNGLPINVICEYNDKRQKIQELEIPNKIDTIFYCFAYNQNGQLTDYVKKNGTKGYVFTGVVCWSNKMLNKVHIRYTDFDERGNWTKSYFITEKGKVFRSKRKIEYW
jgi:hypothetical protein